MNNTEAKLLPCPFEKVDKEVGHHPYVIKAEDGWYYVQCTCGARGPMAPKELEVTSWNTRSSIPKERLLEFIQNRKVFLQGSDWDKHVIFLLCDELTHLSQSLEAIGSMEVKV